VDQPVSWQRFLSHIATVVTDLVLPRWCLNCQQPGAWVCDVCQQSTQLLPLGWCGSCGRRAPAGTTLCRRCSEPLHLTRLVSGLAYAGATEQLIRAIKYRPARAGLTHLVVGELRDRLASAVPENALVVPIPIQPKRLDRRGFNQAEELALAICPLKRVDRHHLARARLVDPQVGLARAARLANMRAVFYWTGSDLANTTVCLIDDVLTTGATLADAARAVRAAGARRVIGITLAQTPPGRSVGK